MQERQKTSDWTMILCFICTIHTATALNEVSYGIHKFTKSIVESIDPQDAGGNFVLSPFSLHSTLSQALIGAGGRTQGELEQALGVTRSRGLAEQYSRIHENLSFLKIANMLVLNKGFEPKKVFIDFIQKGFGTEVKEYDFRNEKMKSVNEINSIVESVTNQRIQRLISPANVDENLKLMMINAVYFKAKWKQAFNPRDSFTSVFQSNKVGNVMTKFMTTEMEARLDETDDLDILELPYTDVSKSMLIFMPKEDDVTDKVLDLVLQYPTQNIKNIPTTTTTISLPSFKIDYKMNVKPALNRMGVSDMFSDRANFTYITNNPLKVSDAIHKAFIEVNEEGTEAAAATVALFSFKSAGFARRFFANRPFYFMVYDFQNQLPLFIGKFSTPSDSLQDTITKEKKNTDYTENLVTSNEAGYKQESDRKEECEPYFETFGLARNNKQECSYKGYRPYGWFIKNKSICMKSEEIYHNMMANKCGPAWCEYAKENYKDWKETYGKECIKQSDDSETPISCIKLKADLKTKTFLACKF